MSLWGDIAFSFKCRCPACKEGTLFTSGFNIVEKCAHCGAPLGDHDIGDGAVVFIIFVLVFSVIPLAWWFEVAFAPAMWVHIALWGGMMLGITLGMLGPLKAYIMLLQHRHRRDE